MKFLSTIKKAGYEPKKRNRLKSLKAVLSTGSPLSEDLFEWFYEKIFIWSFFIFNSIF